MVAGLLGGKASSERAVQTETVRSATLGRHALGLLNGIAMGIRCVSIGAGSAPRASIASRAQGNFVRREVVG